MTRDTLPITGQGVLLTSIGQRPETLLNKHPTMHGQLPTGAKNYPVQNVNSSSVGKPYPTLR